MKDQLLIDKYEDYVVKHNRTLNTEDPEAKKKAWGEEKASVLDFTGYAVSKMGRILIGQTIGNQDVTDQEKEELWMFTRELFDILREMIEEQIRMNNA